MDKYKPTLIEVGKKSPFPGVSSEGGRIHISDNGILNYCVYMNIYSNEVELFRNGKINYGLFCDNGDFPLINLILRIEDLIELDGNFCIQLEPEEMQKDFFKNKSNIFTLFLIDLKNIIRAIRVIGVNFDFISEFHKAAIIQKTANFSISEYDQNLQSLQRIFTIKEMWQRAIKYELIEVGKHN